MKRKPKPIRFQIGEAVIVRNGDSSIQIHGLVWNFSRGPKIEEIDRKRVRLIAEVIDEKKA